MLDFPEIMHQRVEQNETDEEKVEAQAHVEIRETGERDGGTGAGLHRRTLARL